MDVPGRIETIEELEALYRKPSHGAVRKQLSSIDEGMEAFIDRCPFLVLATTNANGSVDASPRGGPAGFVRRLDDRHIAIPDLNGNNRLDSYRNVVQHPYAGVLMMVPGKDETLRINGPAALSIDPELLGGFSGELRTPKMALVIETAEIYGHCAKAFRRAAMWEPESWGEFDDAPDLVGMYAGTGNADGDQRRAELEAAYATGLSLD